MLQELFDAYDKENILQTTDIGMDCDNIWIQIRQYNDRKNNLRH